MRDWLVDLAGPEYVDAILWTLGALLLLVGILAIVKLVRGLGSGTFVAGGRNRKTRLAVMDATAVDNHRRLVLVRRDDVEHLLLIGGPSDLVVEQNIRVIPTRRTAPPRDVVAAAVEEPPHRPELQRGDPARQAAQRAEPQPQTAPEAPQRPAAPLRDPRPPVMAPRPPPAAEASRSQANGSAIEAQRSSEVRAASDARASAAPTPSPRTPEQREGDRAPTVREPEPARLARVTSSPQMPALSPLASRTPSQPNPPSVRVEAVAEPKDDMEEALMEELELSVDEPTPPGRAVPPPRPPLSLDDEMTRLLGELSSQKR